MERIATLLGINLVFLIGLHRELALRRSETLPDSQFVQAESAAGRVRYRCCGDPTKNVTMTGVPR